MQKVEELGYSIGSINEFKGHEGEPCAQGTLKHKGKVIGEWSDDTWGGPMSIHFASDEFATEFTRACATDPRRDPESNAWGGVEDVISEMVMEEMETRELKKWCKQSIVLKTPECGEGEVVRLKKAKWNPASVELEKFIMSRYPGCEIINKRFDPPAAKVSAKAGAKAPSAS